MVLNIPTVRLCIPNGAKVCFNHPFNVICALNSEHNRSKAIYALQSGNCFGNLFISNKMNRFEVLSALLRRAKRYEFAAFCFSLNNACVFAIKNVPAIMSRVGVPNVCACPSTIVKRLTFRLW